MRRASCERELVGHVRQWLIDVRDLSASNWPEKKGSNIVLLCQIDPTPKQEKCLPIRVR